MHRIRAVIPYFTCYCLASVSVRYAAELLFFGCSVKKFVSNFGNVIRRRSNRFGWGTIWLSDSAREKKLCDT